MTVQELINMLMEVEDKTMKVVVSVESGMSCISTSDDVDGWEEEVVIGDDEFVTVFTIGGQETNFE